jgi:hypothetical protein
MSRLLIDVGSTYFKICRGVETTQYPRDFKRAIYNDLMINIGDIIRNHAPEDIYICSSANGGLSTLIIALSNSFSLKYSINTAFNSGINIIDTLLYRDIDSVSAPKDLIDVVIVAGAIDDVKGSFDEKLFRYLNRCNYNNIVYVGSREDRAFLQSGIENLKILDNILTDRLKINGEELKNYLTDLYQADIVGKEDIKELYQITANQIFSTPYIVNRALSHIHKRFAVVEPFIVIDIGGATTDIHYSTDLIKNNFVSDCSFDRLVFKKLGVYKSRESLLFTAKSNEFVYELLNYLNVTENILEERNLKATKILMQLAIFLVLYKVSRQHSEYIELELERLNTVLFTGGITKVLSQKDTESITTFFYKKILRFHKSPEVIIDRDYEIWTYAMERG